MRWLTEDGKAVVFRRLNVKLPVADHKAFRAAADMDGRSMQNIFVDMVRKFVAEVHEARRRTH